MKFRFIDSPKLSAKANMDFDKSLVENFDGTPIFRLYSWEENSFTIGRFQKLKDIQNVKRFGTNYAKRMTGGGLLLHGFDISYSIIIPTSFLDSKNVKESYEYICSFILDFYKKLGLHVEYAKDIDKTLSKSFFCQEGFEAYDMICQGKKIGGNAQRRTKELIFQHGSIPLRGDKREFSGHSLDEFGVNLSEEKAKELLTKSFKEIFTQNLDNILLT